MRPNVCLNGNLVDPSEAQVSVFDRGFLYGDSVYEVVRTYSGVPFELEDHLDRLEDSARRIGMELAAPKSVFAEEVLKTHASSGNDESYLRIVSTRGSGTLGLDPALAQDPLRLVIALPLTLPPPEVYAGATIALVSVRRNLRTAIDPMAKTGNYLNSVMALAEARERGAYEAVMLDHRDYITEGASSNVFVVLGDTLLTPPLDAGILEGITRKVVMRVAEKAGLRLLQLQLPSQVLEKADEIFITSSIREIVPITKVDDSVVGSGQPGPVYERIRTLFAEYVREYVNTRAELTASGGPRPR